MRRFHLHRDKDISGVSATGQVAEGVEFYADGPAVLCWASASPSVEVFYEHGVESVERIHGHEGNTRVVFIDNA